MRNQLIGLSIFFAALSFNPVHALENDSTRYEIFKDNGEFFILDKVTGKITSLREHRANMEAGKLDTLSTTKVETPVKDPRTVKVLEPVKKAPDVQTPVKLPPKAIEFETNDDTEVVLGAGAGSKKVIAPVQTQTPTTLSKDPGTSKPDTSGVITDEMRKASFTQVSGYRSNLSLIQTVQIQGGRIKGTIAVTNKGKKKLDVLELTLFVPKGDGLTFDEHHFMFGYKAGLKPPPAPNVEDPDSADPQIMIVDFPAPPGGGRSKVDIKVTYLKFATEE